MFSTGALLSLACLVSSALATTWKQSDSYVGSQFLSGFDHMAIADPTHGRVYAPSSRSFSLRFTSVANLLGALQELPRPGERGQEEHHLRPRQHAHPPCRSLDEAQRERTGP